MEIKITGKFPDITLMAFGERDDVLIGLTAATIAMLNHRRKPGVTDEQLIEAQSKVMRKLMSADRAEIDLSAMLGGKVK